MFSNFFILFLATFDLRALPLFHFPFTFQNFPRRAAYFPRTLYLRALPLSFSSTCALTQCGATELKFFNALSLYSPKIRNIFMHTLEFLYTLTIISISYKIFHNCKIFPRLEISYNTNTCLLCSTNYQILVLKILHLECLRVQIPIISHSTHQFSIQYWNCEILNF